VPAQPPDALRASGVLFFRAPITARDYCFGTLSSVREIGRMMTIAELNWMELAPMLGIGIVALGMVAVVVLTVVLGRRRRAKAQRLAEALGLTLEASRFWVFSPPVRMVGTIHGHRIEIYHLDKGDGEGVYTLCVLEVTPRVAAGLTFRLRRQGFATKVAELFGAKEITVGDPAFDQACFVQTNEPDYFRTALTGDFRGRLLAMLRSGLPSEIRLETGVIKYVEDDTPLEEDARCQRFSALVPLLCDLADVAEKFACQRR
jgi:hypothetical protein